jgi:drug/metabolite transporter superfamily protein YnfA
MALYGGVIIFTTVLWKACTRYIWAGHVEMAFAYGHMQLLKTRMTSLWRLLLVLLLLLG